MSHANKVKERKWLTMRKIIDEWQIHQYIVLVLDKDIWGMHPYNYFWINGRKYKSVYVHNMPNCIAIEGELKDTFIGQYVKFVL